MKKNTKTAAAGLAVGLINGLFGAGGGMVAVPLLKSLGMDQKQAHANAVAVILPITAVSAVFYLIKGYMTIGDALPFLPAGIPGALIGTWILNKISPRLLKKIFALFMIYAGVRLLFQ